MSGYNKLFMLKLILVFLFIFFASQANPQGLFKKEASQQQTFDQSWFFKEYEPWIDELLTAYNRQNYKVFFKNFSTAVSNTATKHAFRAIYVETYKKNYGKFLAKELIPEKCSFNENFPLLIYRGIFRKDWDVKIGVNFIKEGKSYKILLVSFDKPSSQPQRKPPKATP